MSLEMIELITSTIFWSVFMFCISWIIATLFKAAGEASKNQGRFRGPTQADSPLMKALMENLEKKQDD